ncbi:ubiquitin carboxyl-terminal hydrolase 26-like isoform X2 [Magnolia sinica]|nr:ubiquitin carboxyl-terminal hydrolase 26-like isoform X2 [Magnolia sinica]XP_058092712.1 ubiquitin carboxyl-terminal hydrolase 26-like isoform X2 [Magnolia sinica]
MSEIIQTLGPDPCKDLRSTDSPAGLTNLGATCYANSILQCLYTNKSFREGVFSVEPELVKQHPVLDQLARLFAQLHSSKMAFIDSAPFIKTLELDNGVQQDSHEFFTLFLSLLERSLSHSKVPRSRTFVQDLFRGSVSHVTQCSVCGKESEASSKMEDFYELELNIKGLNNLDESLNDYLSMEQLQGENQYFCESCGRRVDATRCIKLRRLPAVLNFQLKRCVFLPKTTTKKKLTSAFSFPRRLHMAERLCDPSQSQSELTYDLSAILIHRGTAVNSGHYVAHIKDKYSGHWWEFDDEHVSKLGLHPFGAESSSSSAQPEQNLQPATSEQVGSVGNGNHMNSFQPPSSDFNIASHEEIFSSTDAYMLMYTRIDTNENGNKSYITLRADNMDVDEELVSGNGSLPLHLSEEIKELNASYVSSCQEYQLKKGREVDNITERRQEVRLVLSEAPVSSLEDPFFWISADWLRQWADCIIPLPIDNTSIQCSHGKVPVSKVGSMKRVSNKAWSILFSKYGGGPVLSCDDCCILCLKDEAETAVFADNYRDRRAFMKQLAEAAIAGHSLDGNQYYVSKSWLSQWLRRKNVDSPCDADSEPTASIRCPHGGLLPEQAAGAKRLLIPESLWLFLLESASTVKPDDPSGCSPFPSDSETCAVCSLEMTEVACLEDSLRAAKLKQRQNHEKLWQGKSIALSPGCKYYLLPSSWLSKWRSYVTASGKNVSSSVEPESLEDVIDSVKCVKHLRLLERPLDLTCKRGVIVQRTSMTDGLTLITESDWKFFCEEWGVPEEKAIVAEIDITSFKANKLVGSCEEVPISEAHLDPSNDGVNGELEGKPIIRTFAEICEDCIGERESHELMQKLNYQDEDIRVFLVHGKEAPRSVLEASGTTFEADRRTSKRSRRNSSSSSVDLKVSGSTSIYQLKMMIWESFGVVKENQKLHKGSREIEADESSTLADRNIFPGDVLWVTDTEIYENRDIADELSDPKESWQAEEGFRGSKRCQCFKVTCRGILAVDPILGHIFLAMLDIRWAVYN